jgi:hypothetical protein
MFGLFNSKPDKNLQDVYFGSDSYTLKVSEQYLTQRDEKAGTVMIYPKGSECITLRIDMLSFNPKNESIEPTTGYDIIRQDAENKKKNLFFENDMAIAFNEKKSVENGIDLILKFWEIGRKDNSIIMLSATILETLQNDKRVKQLLTAIPEIIKSIEPTEKHNSIEISSRIVNYSTTKQELIDQKIVPLSEDDKKFVNTWIDNGKNIILYYKPNLQQSDFTIKLLDLVFDEWLNDKNNERFSPDSIANGLGMVFGELLSKELSMEWVKVIDEYGEDFGVRSNNNYTSFPISSVYKRIESRASGFFSDIFEVVKHTIGK